MNFTIVYMVHGWKICVLFGSQGGVDLVQQGITVLDQMFNQVDDCKFVVQIETQESDRTINTQDL